MTYSFFRFPVDTFEEAIGLGRSLAFRQIVGTAAEEMQRTLAAGASVSWFLKSIGRKPTFTAL